MTINRDQVSSSLRMAEPGEVAGRWIMTRDGTACTFELRIERVEHANAHTLAGADCLRTLLGDGIAGWRPTPDGIAFADADGLTLALFADQGDGTAVAALAGGAVAMRRPPD